MGQRRRDPAGTRRLRAGGGFFRSWTVASVMSPDETGVAVRHARGEECSAVLGVLDGANLETDADAIRSAIDRGAVLVAEPSVDDRSSLLGALVLDGEEITHVAVRRRRRGQGIGTALVRRAVAECGTLLAEFDAPVRPFYEAIGFEIEPAADDDRFVGRGPSDERFDEVTTGGE